jgi:hypothetical protein
MGFGLAVGFTEHFNTQLVTTLYKSLSHTDKSSQSRSSLPCLEVASNSARSPSSRFPNCPGLIYQLLSLSLYIYIHIYTEVLKSKSKLLYDWQFTVNQFVFAPSPLRFTTRFFFQWNPCGHSPSGTSSQMRKWVCLL